MDRPNRRTESNPRATHSLIVGRFGPGPNFLVDSACLLFAAWTVVCHIVVFSHGNAYHLLVATAGLLVLMSAFVSMKLGKGQGGVLGPWDSPWKRTGETQSRLFVARVTLGVSAVAIVAVYKLTGDRFALWATSLLFFAVSFWLLVREPSPDGSGEPGNGHCVFKQRPSRSCDSRSEPKGTWAFLWLLGVLSAIVTLVAHRFRSDDFLYVNLAVSVAGFPHDPLLQLDGVYGMGLPLRGGFYRVHSVEILAGVLSLITGLECIALLHLVVAGLAGFFVPLALARLFQLLDPDRWLWAVMIVMAVYVFDGTTNWGFSNYALVRLFEGKAILLTVMMPLIAAYGLRFGLSPSWKNFGWLAAAQIAGVGMSSTGLWLGPATACLAVLTPSRLRPRDVKNAVWGALSGTYVLALGLWIWWDLRSGNRAVESSLADTEANGVIASAPAGHPGPEIVWGQGDYFIAEVIVVLAAWLLCRTTLARRYVVVFCLGALAFFANPLLTDFVAGYLTGNATYWRVAWVAPIPVFIALCFVSVLRPRAGWLERRLREAIMLAALSLFLILVPSKVTLSQENRVLVHWPDLKVPRSFSAVRAVMQHVSAGSYVLAPKMVSMYLPTVNRNAFPLLCRPDQFPGSTREVETRRRLVGIVEKKVSDFDRAWFIKQLNRLKVTGVVLRKRAKSGELHRALRQAGFRRVARAAGHIIWTRKL